MTLQLAAVLLVLLNKRLVLISDVVVVQERALEQPIWQVGNSRPHYLERAVFVNILPVGTEQEVLLHLAVLAKGTFQADIIEGSNFIPVRHIFHVLNRPLRETSD